MFKQITITVAALAFLVACVPEKGPVQEKQVQAQKAAEAANSIRMNENSEIDNIKRRLELTSNPGQIGFVLLMNAAGQPIYYTGVKGKITSGSKRLTAPNQRWSVNAAGGGTNQALGPSPSDEGTWGSSSDYIYFWTDKDEYFQWNGMYLYSDKPFRLRVEPLIINLQPK